LRQAFPAELVGRELITTAVGLNSAVFNSARILGPALGGLVVAVLGVAGAFALNGASYLAVLVSLVLMRLAAVGAQPSARDKTPLMQIQEALTFASREPRIVFTLSALCCLGIFGFNYSTFLPLLARYELDLGASGYGTLSTALGAGSVLGALGIAHLGYRSPRRQVVGGLAFGVILASIGLSPWLWLSIALMGALGMAGVVFTTTANTTLQLAVPDTMRGRIMGLYTLLLAGMTPPGALATGFLAGLWGIRAAVAIEAIICVAGVLAAFGYLVRSERRAILELDPALA
jgi:MFS family permease